MTYKELSTYEETVTRVIEKAIVEFTCEQCNKKETKNVSKSWNYSSSHPDGWQRTTIAGKYLLVCDECYAKRLEMIRSEPYRSLSNTLDYILGEFYYIDDYDSSDHEVPDSFDSMEVIFNNISQYVKDYEEKINGFR